MAPGTAVTRLVSVTIVTFDPPDGMLERAVERVVATTGADRSGAALDPRASFEVDLLVVDVGGRARSRLDAADLAGRATVLDLGRNVGFAGALHEGFERGISAGADVLVGLNDDVVVGDGWLAPLVAALDADERLGAVQPLLVQPGTSPPAIDSAGVEIDRYGAGSDRSRGRPASEAESGRVTAVTGGAAAWSARFIAEVGPPDVRFFLYYEDVEWCRRGSRAGWEFGLVAESVVEHAGSASTAALGEARRQLQERNRLWSTAMHGGPGEIARAVWLSVRRLRHAPRAVHRRALLAGIGGGGRRLLERLARRGVPAPETASAGPPAFLRAAVGRDEG